MKKKSETIVIFRKWRDDGSIIALFPCEPGTFDSGTCNSFMRVGQHSAANPHGVIAHSKLATAEQYADLKQELEAAPYWYRLKVDKRLRRVHYETRCKAISRISKESDHD